MVVTEKEEAGQEKEKIRKKPREKLSWGARIRKKKKKAPQKSIVWGKNKEKQEKKPRMKSGSVPNIKSENFQKYNRLKV